MPRGAVDVAMSRTKESPSVAGAATEIGLVPRIGWEGKMGEVRKGNDELKNMTKKNALTIY